MKSVHELSFRSELFVFGLVALENVFKGLINKPVSLKTCTILFFYITPPKTHRLVGFLKILYKQIIPLVCKSTCVPVLMEL